MSKVSFRFCWGKMSRSDNHRFLELFSHKLCDPIHGNCYHQSVSNFPYILSINSVGLLRVQDKTKTCELLLCTIWRQQKCKDKLQLTIEYEADRMVNLGDSFRQTYIEWRYQELKKIRLGSKCWWILCRESSYFYQIVDKMIRHIRVFFFHLY